MKRLIPLALLVAGCTTAKTMMLDDRTAMISGRDMGWGDSTDVTRKILTTAAQMAQARGYELFEIVSTEDTTKSGYVPIAGQATTNTVGSAYCYGAWCNAAATTHTTATPGYLAPYTQAGANVVVHFYHPGEVEAGKSGVFNAASILNQR